MLIKGDEEEFNKRYGKFASILMEKIQDLVNKECKVTDARICIYSSLSATFLALCLKNIKESYREEWIKDFLEIATRNDDEMQ